LTENEKQISNPDADIKNDQINDSLDSLNLHSQQYDYLDNLFEQSISNNNFIQKNLFDQNSQNPLYKKIYTDFEKIMKETKEIFTLKFD
jgi:hypothetical protein